MDEIELSEDDCDTVFYTGGAIDLGEAAAETLALALDPFPRSPGAAAALREAGVGGVQSGLHIDRDLVEEAWELGVGATFHAVFNRRGDDPVAGSFAATATVRSLHDGEVRPTVGV